MLINTINVIKIKMIGGIEDKMSFVRDNFSQDDIVRALCRINWKSLFCEELGLEGKLAERFLQFEVKFEDEESSWWPKSPLYENTEFCIEKEEVVLRRGFVAQPRFRVIINMGELYPIASALMDNEPILLEYDIKRILCILAEAEGILSSRRLEVCLSKHVYELVINKLFNELVIK